MEWIWPTAPLLSLLTLFGTTISIPIKPPRPRNANCCFLCPNGDSSLIHHHNARVRHAGVQGSGDVRFVAPTIVHIYLVQLLVAISVVIIYISSLCRNARTCADAILRTRSFAKRPLACLFTCAVIEGLYSCGLGTSCTKYD